MAEPKESRSAPQTVGAGRPGHRLRIVVGDSQRHDHLPVAEWITRRALDVGLAGATVTRADFGFGAASRKKALGLGSLSADASMVVDIVDSRDKLIAFVKELDDKAVVRQGLVTLESLEVLAYRGG